MIGDAFARALGEIQSTNSLPMLARLRGRLESSHKGDPDLKSLLTMLETKRQGLLETALVESGHATFVVPIESGTQWYRVEWRLDSPRVRRTRQGGGAWYVVARGREALLDTAPAYDGDENAPRWQRALQPLVQAMLVSRGW